MYIPSKSLSFFLQIFYCALDLHRTFSRQFILQTNSNASLEGSLLLDKFQQHIYVYTKDFKTLLSISTDFDYFFSMTYSKAFFNTNNLIRSTTVLRKFRHNQKSGSTFMKSTGNHYCLNVKSLKKSSCGKFLNILMTIKTYSVGQILT